MITVQRAPLVAELVAPLVACTGVPMTVHVVIENRTSRTETLSLAVGRSANFAFAGLGETQCSVREPARLALAASLHASFLGLLVPRRCFANLLGFLRLQMLPHTTRAFDYIVVPLTCGKLQLPLFSLTSSRSSAEWFAEFSAKQRHVLVNAG